VNVIFGLDFENHLPHPLSRKQVDNRAPTRTALVQRECEATEGLLIFERVHIQSLLWKQRLGVGSAQLPGCVQSIAWDSLFGLAALVENFQNAESPKNVEILPLLGSESQSSAGHCKNYFGAIKTNRRRRCRTRVPRDSSLWWGVLTAERRRPSSDCSLGWGSQVMPRCSRCLPQ
jgi:hypothetical protein